MVGSFSHWHLPHLDGVSVAVPDHGEQLAGGTVAAWTMLKRPDLHNAEA
jgi:hypothetical protein